MSIDWMKEFKRSASEKVRPPMAGPGTGLTESVSQSIKQSIRTGFIKKGASFSETHEDETMNTIGLTNHVIRETPSAKSTTALSDIASSNSTFSTLRARVMPSKLPTIDCSALPRYVPPLTRATGSEQAMGNEGEATILPRADSPKLPPSPVRKVLQGSTNLTKDGQDRNVVYQKVVRSRLMSDSSSDSDSEDNTVQNNVRNCRKAPLYSVSVQAKSSSSESTPSPRTPNSFKILSGIATREATAFKFPPSPSLQSGHSMSSSRQSSDETFSTSAAVTSPYNSIRSRSTSSEMYDEQGLANINMTSGNTQLGYPLPGATSAVTPMKSAKNGPGLAGVNMMMTTSLSPAALPRSRRPSPLRKQRAIAEESPTLVGSPHSTANTLITLSHGDLMSIASSSANQSTVTGIRCHSAMDSGVSDSGHSGHYPPTPSPLNRSPRCNSANGTPESSSRQQSAESGASLSDTEDGTRNDAAAIFRKVTIKKKEKTAFERALEARNSNPLEPTSPILNSSKPGTPDAIVRIADDKNNRLVEFAPSVRYAGQGERCNRCESTSCTSSSGNVQLKDDTRSEREEMLDGIGNEDVQGNEHSCNAWHEAIGNINEQCPQSCRTPVMYTSKCVAGRHSSSSLVDSADSQCSSSVAYPVSKMEHTAPATGISASGARTLACGQCSEPLSERAQGRSNSGTKLKRLSDSAKKIRECLVACYAFSSGQRSCFYGINALNSSKSPRRSSFESSACQLVSLKALEMHEETNSSRTVHRDTLCQHFGSASECQVKDEHSNQGEVEVLEQPVEHNIDPTLCAECSRLTESKRSEINANSIQEGNPGQSSQSELFKVEPNAQLAEAIQHSPKKRNILKVKSRLELSTDGIAYIEDSDWEMASEGSSLIGFDPISLVDRDSSGNINRANGESVQVCDGLEQLSSLDCSVDYCVSKFSEHPNEGIFSQASNTNTDAESFALHDLTCKLVHGPGVAGGVQLSVHHLKVDQANQSGDDDYLSALNNELLTANTVPECFKGLTSVNDWLQSSQTDHLEDNFELGNLINDSQCEGGSASNSQAGEQFRLCEGGSNRSPTQSRTGLNTAQVTGPVDGTIQAKQLVPNWTLESHGPTNVTTLLQSNREQFNLSLERVQDYTDRQCAAMTTFKPVTNSVADASTMLDKACAGKPSVSENEPNWIRQLLMNINTDITSTTEKFNSTDYSTSRRSEDDKEVGRQRLAYAGLKEDKSGRYVDAINKECNKGRSLRELENESVPLIAVENQLCSCSNSIGRQWCLLEKPNLKGDQLDKDGDDYLSAIKFKCDQVNLIVSQIRKEEAFKLKSNYCRKTAFNLIPVSNSTRLADGEEVCHLQRSHSTVNYNSFSSQLNNYDAPHPISNCERVSQVHEEEHDLAKQVESRSELGIDDKNVCKRHANNVWSGFKEKIDCDCVQALSLRPEIPELMTNNSSSTDGREYHNCQNNNELNTEQKQPVALCHYETIFSVSSGIPQNDFSDNRNQLEPNEIEVNNAVKQVILKTGKNREKSKLSNILVKNSTMDKVSSDQQQLPTNLVIGCEETQSKQEDEYNSVSKYATPTIIRVQQAAEQSQQPLTLESKVVQCGGSNLVGTDISDVNSEEANLEVCHNSAHESANYSQTPSNPVLDLVVAAPLPPPLPLQPPPTRTRLPVEVSAEPPTTLVSNEVTDHGFGSASSSKFIQLSFSAAPVEAAVAATLKPEKRQIPQHSAGLSSLSDLKSTLPDSALYLYSSSSSPPSCSVSASIQSDSRPNLLPSDGQFKYDTWSSPTRATSVQEVIESANSLSAKGKQTAKQELVDETSSLEKYFTQILEHSIANDSSSHTSQRPSVLMELPVESCVDDEDEDDEDILDVCPDLSDSDSSSGEDVVYTAPPRQLYGNPLCYSLHTIAEESERESDHELNSISSLEDNNTERNAMHVPDIHVSTEDDLELDYQADVFPVAANVRSSLSSQFNTVRRFAPEYDEFSDAMADVSLQFSLHQDDRSQVNIEASRLEKYFISGLLGSVEYSYPADAEFETDSEQSLPKIKPGSRSERRTLNGEPRPVMAQLPRVALTQSLPKDAIESLDQGPDHVVPKDECVNSSVKEDSLNENRIVGDAMDQLTTGEPKRQMVEVGSQVDSSLHAQVDHELSVFVNNLLAQVSSAMNVKSTGSSSVPLRALEAQIVHLMQTVSPALLSEANSSNSSTIGSNNSDYGSDTLESSSEEDHGPTNDRFNGKLRHSKLTSTLPDEPVSVICQQLIGSLKSLSESVNTISCQDAAPENETSLPENVSKAITNKITALMHSVQSNRLVTSPSPTIKPAQDEATSSKSPASMIEVSTDLKPPSELGSICASVSIHSCENSDGDEEEPISPEMNSMLTKNIPLEGDAKSDRSEASAATDKDKESATCWEDRMSLLAKTQVEAEFSSVTKKPSISGGEQVSRATGLNRTVIKIDGSATACPLSEPLNERSQSSDSVASVQTVKAAKDESQTSLRVTEKEIDATESSEDNAIKVIRHQGTNYCESSHRPLAAKSTGNIVQLLAKHSLRDTGYYSHLSQESVRSNSKSHDALHVASFEDDLHEVSIVHSSHTDYRTMPARGSRSKATAKITFSHGSLLDALSINVPDATVSSRPCRSASLRPVPDECSRASSVPKRTRSNLFSASTNVLRRIWRDDTLKNGSATSSPHKLRHKLRSGLRDSASGGSVPHISVSDFSENSVSGRGSLGSSNDVDSPTKVEDACLANDADDIDRIIKLQSQSHSSLSSAGFHNRADSMSSVYSNSGRYGTVQVTGEVLFGLSYNYKSGSLEVHIKECRNLAAADSKRGRSDPYVKVYLLPDRTKCGKRKTKVKKATLNPAFDEVVKFQLTISEIESRSLWISIWHSDIFARNDFLGEVVLPLGHEVFDSPGLKWYPLQDLTEPGTAMDNINYKGDLFVALKFVPLETGSRATILDSTQGQLHVLVKEANNLIPTRANGTSDPFVKSYFLPDRSKNGKQKSQVVKKCCNPKWNHTFVYDELNLGHLKTRSVELTIWDHDKLATNSFLGGVRLGLGQGLFEGQLAEWSDSSGDEVCLWQQMLDKPNMWVYGQLKLRPRHADPLVPGASSCFF
ncbi:Synaptotagmin-like protein 4 [Halotydeus destructor]|nr:Synaptotagmin-like protein 4 [Halotydeus destructor]